MFRCEKGLFDLRLLSFYVMWPFCMICDDGLMEYFIIFTYFSLYLLGSIDPFDLRIFVSEFVLSGILCSVIILFQILI